MRSGTILALDHLFTFVEPGAPEAERLARDGLRESYSRAHPGQGTANICYCFDNAYLELLWQTDRAEIAAPALARTGLAERADWRRNGACPFGIGLRGASLPFETWDYCPPYLPHGWAIPVGAASADPRQPFLFRSPGDSRPDAWTDGKAGLRQQGAGLAEIAGLHLDFPAGLEPGVEVLMLAAAGLLTLGAADNWRLTLTLSHSGTGPARRLSLPDFTWDRPIQR